MPLIKKCKQCGKEFKVKPSKYDEKKFCSKECHNFSMMKTTSKICLYCKKEFSGRPSDIKNRKYCSRKCRSEAENNSIPYDTLYKVYVIDRNDTRSAGKILGVSKRKISSALKYYNIPIRDVITQRKGDNYKRPSKDDLQKLYCEDFLSTKEIGNMFNVHESTVNIWLKKNNINLRQGGEGKKGKDFIKPSKEEVIEYYLEKKFSTDDLAKIFGSTNVTMCKILDEYGIDRRQTSFNARGLLICDDGDEVRSSLEKIVDDFLYSNNMVHKYDARLPKPFNRYRTDFLVQNTYIEIWGVINNKTYDERRIKKLKVYEELGSNLISIYPHEFKDINSLYEKIKTNIK